jgi:hypothetical protein
MGWTCQYDYKGHCKRVEKTCVPGMKGCVLNSSDYIFSGALREAPKKKEEKTEAIDFAALVRSN